jgi:hypothetical protein
MSKNKLQIRNWQSPITISQAARPPRTVLAPATITNQDVPVHKIIIFVYLTKRLPFIRKACRALHPKCTLFPTAPLAQMLDEP